MKKVKITITAITILAIIGGVLAFRAKTLNSVCFLRSDSATITCLAIGLGTTVGSLGPQTYATAEVFDGANYTDCTAQQAANKLPCENLVHTKPEGD